METAAQVPYTNLSGLRTGDEAARGGRQGDRWHADVHFVAAADETGSRRIERSSPSACPNPDLHSQRYRSESVIMCGSDWMEGQLMMLRKTMIVLLATAAVSMLVPGVAAARGGGG